MATVSLQLLVKDEFNAVADIVAAAMDSFDQINLTVSDKTTKNKLHRLFGPDHKVVVQWREWTDDFSAARNANFAMSTTDYVFWLDADDEFDFSEIPKLVELAEKGNYVVIYLPYNYAQDETGRCVARHWRERLIKRAHPFEWRGRVHETYISDEPYQSTRVNSEVLHHGQAHHGDSVLRNHSILLKAVEETDDPRYLHYLGLSHYTLGQYADAIKVLTDFVTKSGWDEEIYRSYCTMAEAAYAAGNPNLAIQYALNAASLFPAYPQAYWLLTQFESDQDNFAEAFEWAKVAQTKPIPKSMSIVDPTNVSRTWLVGARAAYMLGDHKTAYEWISKIPDEPLAQEFIPIFREEAEKEVFLKLLPTILPYFRNERMVWENLNDDVKYDGRTIPFREKVTNPKNWAADEITIFCGKGFEEWGPGTLDKGMGGSEEAIVYLARELAKLGWRVTVYNEIDEAYDDWIPESHVVPRLEGHQHNNMKTVDTIEPVLEKHVRYLPWRHLDKRDKFNVFVSWRTPAFVDPIDAKVKIVDLHDIIPEEGLVDKPEITYFVKSKFQRDLYPGIKKAKFHIIGNGILKEQFDEDTKDD